MTDIGSGILFPLCALPFNVLVLLVFLLKKHIHSRETEMFKSLIIVNFIGLLIEILCTGASFIHNDFTFISNFLLKTYLVYIITWASLFTVYIYFISHEEEQIIKFENKQVRYWFILYLIIIFIVYILPIELIIKDGFKVRYTTGMAVSFTYFISVFLSAILLIILFKNF